MYSFKNDYSEGAHPLVMEALLKTNLEQTTGYGEDEYCDLAKLNIKKYLNNDDVDIHFLVGGTQANLTLIASALKSYQACISVALGHINTHETGAIEATGHKILTADKANGKLEVADIELILSEHQDEHMVQPKMVYISNPTEVGTIYSVDELKELYQCCQANGLYLFVDGARLASALALTKNSVTLADLTRYSDAYYIGGTKCGALFGEAVVIVNDALKKDFRYSIKQRGALMAKGRLLGVQFKALFENDLYFDIGKHSNEMADKIRTALKKHNVEMLVETYSNQIFPILDDRIIKLIANKYEYTYMHKVSETKSCIRLVTSFATIEEKVNEFINDLNSFFE